MRFVSAEEVDGVLTHGGLVETLREAFRKGAVQPLRHHHTVERPAGTASTLLLMPAWSDFSAPAFEGDGYVGVKIVTVSPDNNAKGLPAIMGIYLLLDGQTGEPRALIDGQRITLWRTACASALAADYLARKDASSMLMVGAGALAPFLVRAHAAVRPVKRVAVWNRTPANAERLVETLQADGFEARLAETIDDELGEADIVSCATISSVPLIHGAKLQPGTHVDLVGAFAPTMRESDDEAIRRARVFVDTIGGATKEAGDIVQALESGALSRDDIQADLYDLCRGQKKGRESDDEITLFKSVGAAIEDLAAGIAVWEKLGG
ncbi:ornithine cyclodeaminase family protein [Chelativorans sp. ZYF759]|uniref:ornithine cyclodeaminase family protein n=1 Tax=Chelativorans sp. ZYF759 TaxID=2692213 RepID=UPI00145DD196|nr:ornithine cyclodeaminase family protein [Chelativorans sp. ZYF759]NMG39437.1 ornithine cyclodeaminase family protein [Chelativorans sp. ZYF759]